MGRKELPVNPKEWKQYGSLLANGVEYGGTQGVLVLVPRSARSVFPVFGLSDPVVLIVDIPVSTVLAITRVPSPE